MSSRDERARELVRRADEGAGRQDVKLVADYLRRQHRAWARSVETAVRALRAGDDGTGPVEVLQEVIRQLRAGGDRNMYGCLPCPNCGSPYRAAYIRHAGPPQIECDECGLKQPGVRTDDPDLGEGGAWNVAEPKLEVVP